MYINNTVSKSDRSFTFLSIVNERSLVNTILQKEGGQKMLICYRILLQYSPNNFIVYGKVIFLYNNRRAPA